ncbi:N-acetylglucosamine-binding protein GbpA [Alcaligenaceae bacterium CGII-47]|nr:N-acetylglucosamine-binding protein GbpA [Alcaligenaceae bacterium CGII-47]
MIAIIRLFAILALLTSGSVFAHGYISEPAGRNLLCKTGANGQCGAIQWEPQSLEAPSGFPHGGPPDGRIASAGHRHFSELDVQSADRWTKQEVKAGPFPITWTFTANHVTRSWRYYLTRPDWNPNQSLTRTAFDLEPFCVVDGHMARPPQKVTHQCVLPRRNGYQLILAVWEVGDTSNSFYNLLDARFSDSSQPAPQEWRQAGIIHPSVDLAAGDNAKTRVFDAHGERTEFQTVLTISSTAQGSKSNWPHALASKINAEQSLIRAGQRSNDGQIHPVYGQNLVYIQDGSTLARVEIELEQREPAAVNAISVSGLAAEYPLEAGRVTLDFTVVAQGDLHITNTLYDQNGVAKGHAAADIKDDSRRFTLAVSDLKAGHHQLVIKAIPKAGDAPLQQVLNLTFKGPDNNDGYQYVFPQGLVSYAAGTKVLQPRNGRVYQCKPFPYSGYCVQWSPYATHYEPAVGSHWQLAWDEVK